jgi:GT2 family glycosyltransferase
MLARHSIVDALGGMDESVFMFMEDLDLCYRVREAGWKIFYLADATIIHKGGRSQDTYSGSLRATNAEAKYAFFRKHFGRSTALACRAILLIQSVFRLTVSLCLMPVVAAFPRAKRAFRGAWAVGEHWHLLRWALGRRPTEGTL